MLSAIVLELEAVKPAALPVSHGAMAYAAALDLFMRYDVEMARQLHDNQGLKPLKVGLVTGKLREHERCLLIPAGALVQWRLAGIAANIANSLRQMSPQGGVRLGDGLFEIKNIYTATTKHRYAGYTTYPELAAKWHQCTRLPSTITLDFVTPATFRSGKHEQPFPVPELVFQSLTRQWEAWSPVPLPDCEQSLFKESVALGNWRGETRRVELGGRRTVGFVGTFSYRLLDKTPELARRLGLLSDFAFYAGVGWQTAHGLGQVLATSK